jgi:glycosyltransferase involved in cell wall biosynthesis
MNKCVVDTINILHLSGLNGLFRKRTDIIVKIFDNIYNQGITNFRLNIVIQGNFDKNKMTIFDKPFIDLTYGHLSYSEILNKYNDNHISIQLSKHEGLGLGFFESCFMNTPVITLNAPPHNEIIHQNKNGWLLSCSVEKDKNPENPFTIIGQTQINELVIVNEIKQILLDKNNINDIIKNTKKYTETNLYFQKSFMSS